VLYALSITFATGLEGSEYVLQLEAMRPDGWFEDAMEKIRTRRPYKQR
jgi:hypothetical protein